MPQTSDFLEKLRLIFLCNFHREHSLLIENKKLSPKINAKNIEFRTSIEFTAFAVAFTLLLNRYGGHLKLKLELLSCQELREHLTGKGSGQSKRLLGECVLFFSLSEMTFHACMLNMVFFLYCLDS